MSDQETKRVEDTAEIGQAPKPSSYNPAALFHLVEDLLTDEYKFKTVIAVDPSPMHEGHVLAIGSTEGKVVQVKVTKERMQEYLEKKRAEEAASDAEQAGEAG